MYFSYFPKGTYDLAGNGNLKLVTNLMRRVKVRSKIIDEASLYDLYDVPNGETPEITALKHLGSTYYHWVILLTNNITDRYYEWPMRQADFADFLTDKYGAGSEDAVHHYELAQTSGATTSIDNSHMLEVNSDTDGATTITNREYEERVQNDLRQIRLLDERYLDAFIEEFFALIKKNRF